MSKEKMLVVIAPVYKRLLNYIIDTFVCYAIILLLDQLGLLLQQNFDDTTFVMGPLVYGNLKFSMFLTVIQIVYYGLFESLTGRTLGKYATETKVIGADGTIPGSDRIFLRTLCRLIPFELLSFLGAVPVGWHDRFSKTLVVDIYGVKKQDLKNRREQDAQHEDNINE